MENYTNYIQLRVGRVLHFDVYCKSISNIGSLTFKHQLLTNILILVISLQDYVKAFDHVDRNIVLQKLKSYRVPDFIVH